MAKFKVAAVQTYSEVYESEKNLASMCRSIEEAARNGARLIVFPECMNAGYVWKDPESAVKAADPIPGRFTEEIGKLTKKYNVFVATGMSERHNGKVFNAGALVGPQGLIGKYEKNFLFDFDPYFFALGETGYPVYKTEIGNIGMFICADARIPEGARALTMNGANILLHLTNSTTHEQHLSHVPTRGNENEVWMISADKAGREEGLTYPGHTLIIAPDGTVKAEGGQFDHGILYADIDTAEVDRVRATEDSIISTRRPDTYGILGEPYESLPLARVTAKAVVPSEVAVLVAAVQVTNTDGNFAAALERAVQVGYEAGKENSRIVVFPELFLGTANLSPAQARELAGHTPEILKAFAAPAKAWGAWYVLDSVEQADGGLYHTTFVVGPSGEVVERYRKVHLNAAERKWAKAGSSYCVLNLPFGNLGLMTGHEVRYCEVARVLTCMGADIIAVPSAWEAERDANLFLRERALENKIFVVASNRLDSKVGGESRILLPSGALQHKSECGQFDYTFGYLNLVWARDKQIRPGTELFKNRRPELYDTIIGADHKAQRQRA
ncbi:MAG: carbon-nitrogen hydrolase family protein [Candidimonas sp.]|nr:MAG: carbon-nitrogen hydrolase family protein [Candidimonas sp.]